MISFALTKLNNWTKKRQEKIRWFEDQQEYWLSGLFEQITDMNGLPNNPDVNLSNMFQPEDLQHVFRCLQLATMPHGRVPERLRKAISMRGWYMECTEFQDSGMLFSKITVFARKGWIAYKCPVKKNRRLNDHDRCELYI
jgi:hypothetical protein